MIYLKINYDGEEDMRGHLPEEFINPIPKYADGYVGYFEINGLTTIRLLIDIINDLDIDGHEPELVQEIGNE